VDGGSTAKYVYDVFNQRVHVQTASATTEYIYDYAGRRVSGWLSPNNYGNQGRIYWDGQQIGFRSSDGTNFDHQDILGTERLRTTYSGAVGATYQSLPWGDGYTATVNNSGADQDSLHYAGLEHDAESDTEHAQFRNYASAQGRWLVPDSYLGSYGLTNPQSMNRYAYALNNPVSFIDPSGLDATCDTDPQTGLLECTSYYPINPPPTGCVSFGTQGCISQECGSIFGCDGPPISSPGGVGINVSALGPPRTAVLSKSKAQKLCEDKLFATAIAQGISSALGVGTPGSDPQGDLASAAKSAASSPAFRATAGVLAAQLGSTLLTRAGAVRLGVLISEEFVPGLGWAATAYIGYSALSTAMSYYDDNVASCSE
jgi:RHS repeat-associated protein